MKNEKCVKTGIATETAALRWDGGRRVGAPGLQWVALILAVLLLALVAPQVARADSYVSYYVNTTSNVPFIGVSTNQANVVLASTTNVFNLSTTAGNTNNPLLWPACPLIVDHNNYLPSRFITHQEQGQCMAANVGILTKRYAGSVDGSHWQTNPCPLVLTLTANGTVQVQNFTNYDSGGFQYFALFTEENTNASVAWTNLWMGDGFNRGL